MLPYSAGAHLALAGPFTILDFPTPIDPPLVYVGTAVDGLYLDRPEDVERYNVAFSNVQRVALSFELIKDVLKFLEST
ncbi:Scr1 family TA system antitoxin-like transcriptional regulator [Nocardiopsis sp. frass3]